MSILWSILATSPQTTTRMQRSLPQTEDEEVGGTDCVSCLKKFDVICPHCATPQPRLSAIGGSILDANKGVHPAKESPMREPVHQPATMISRSHGNTHIKYVKNLVLNFQPTYVNVFADQRPIRVDVATDVEELESASDDVFILKTDWPEESSLPSNTRESDPSAAQTPRVETTNEQKELMITRLIDHTENLYRDVMSEITKNNRLPKEIVQKLYQQFRLRLLGVTKRLEFMMEVDSQDVEKVLKLQPEVQQVLAEVVPAKRREEVTWKEFFSHPKPCTDDIRSQTSQSEQTDLVGGRFEEANADVADMQNTLASALQHTQDLYSRWNDMEKWLQKMQRKLDSGSETYSDDFGSTLAKLKAMTKEYEEMDPAFQALKQDLAHLIQNCTYEYRPVLLQTFNKFQERYTKTVDQIGRFETLFSRWNKFRNEHKVAQAKLKKLQASLTSQVIKHDEVVKIISEIQKLRKSMTPWHHEVKTLDEMIMNTQMDVKNHFTRITLHFRSDLQAFENLCDSVAQTASQKEEQLRELLQRWKDFDARKNSLFKALEQADGILAKAKARSSSLQGIKDLVAKIHEIRDDVSASQTAYDQMCELGRQIMLAEPSKTAHIQTQLDQVNEALKQVQSKLEERHQHYSSVVSLWQEYNVAKEGVSRILQDVSRLVEKDIAFNMQAVVQGTLDPHKTQLDTMTKKGAQLLKELHEVPNFNVKVMEQDVGDINLKWETAIKEALDTIWRGSGRVEDERLRAYTKGRGAPRLPRISLRVTTDLTIEESTFLVLPSNPKLDLSKGKFSSDFLKIRGTRLQEECREKYPKGIKYGEIAVTGRGGEGLHVKHIFHCCLPDKQEDDALKRAVTDIVTKSLRMADAFAYNKAPSIRIPALALRDNQYQTHVVAEAIYHAVKDYGNQHPNTTICDVSVTLPGDSELVQIFMTEDDRYRQGQLARIVHEIEMQRLPKPSVNGAESLAAISTPHSWSSTHDELRVIKLSQESADYKRVKDTFLATILMDTNIKPRTDPSDLIEIVSIEIIRNTLVDKLYDNRGQAMMYKDGLDFHSNKQPLWLWHGTNEDAADEIIKYGFSKRFCKRPKFGEAVYFARTTNYSSAEKYAKRNTRGERIVFYCKVRVGKCVQAQDGMRFPSTRQEAEGQTDFDCVVDDLQHPSIYAVYNDAQAYPEYKIVFKER